MSEERLKLAIGKLEYALSRAESNGAILIEAIKDKPQDNITNRDEEYEVLEKKHDLLKKQAAKAIADIESLISMRGQK